MAVGVISEELLELLLQNPHVTNHIGQTPLHLATSCNIHLAVQKLLRRGANVNAIDDRGRSPLHEFAAIQSSPSLEVLETLVEAGANTHLRDSMGYSALHLAVGVGNRPLVERLWGRTLAISVDSDAGVYFLNTAANLKNSPTEMASIMCRMFPEDVVYRNLLGEAYFAVGRHSEARDAFRASVHRDNPNEIAAGPLRHRVYCVGCHKPINGQRWKCLDKSCSKYDWCARCVEIRGSVGSLCSHDRLMSIPSSKVKNLCKIFESGNLGDGGSASHPSHNR